MSIAPNNTRQGCMLFQTIHCHLNISTEARKSYMHLSKWLISLSLSLWFTALGSAIVIEFLLVFSLGVLLLFFTCKCAFLLVNERRNRHMESSEIASVQSSHEPTVSLSYLSGFIIMIENILFHRNCLFVAKILNAYRVSCDRIRPKPAHRRERYTGEGNVMIDLL
jgi:hypothetical protein